MNRGRCMVQAIFLVVCVMVMLQGTCAAQMPCEHEFVEIEIPGDCRNPGMRYKECSKCGEQIDFENTPALGHTYSGWVTETSAKCTEEGIQSRTCQRCGAREEQTIPPAGHRYAEEVHEATCTKGGKVYLVCEACGDRNLKQELAALGHDYDEGVITKEPTDRAMGRRTFTCQRCGNTRTENIPRLDKPDGETQAAAEDPEDNESSVKETRRKSHGKRPNRKKEKTQVFFQDAWRWAEQNGIFAGTDAENLSPDSVCTRAQTVMALWQAAGAPEPNETECCFADVSADQAYYQAVLWAVENEITTGIDAAHFGPDERCTRAQAMTLLYKAQGSPACEARERFKDVDREDYFYQPVIWAIQNQFTSGVCRYYFGSFQSCTCVQLATFLYQIYQ